jgi:hypothetical protein
MDLPLRNGDVVSTSILQGISRRSSTARGGFFTLPSEVMSGSFGLDTTALPKSFSVGWHGKHHGVEIQLGVVVGKQHVQSSSCHDMNHTTLMLICGHCAN